MIGAFFLLVLGTIMGVKMLQSASEDQNPGLGFAGMLVTVFAGGSLLLLLLLYAIGVR